jgi:hypothetical protein
MGLFQYAVAIVNADGSREEEVRPWVDTGAMYCQFPESLLRSLGYEPNASRVFRMADGSTVSRQFGHVNMRIGTEIQPVHCVFDTTNDGMMLLGAIALEAFSLAADPVDKVLKPSIGMMLPLLPEEDEPK